MPTGAEERATAVTGFVAVAAVGAATALGPWDGAPGTRTWWWVAYALFAAAFVADDVADRRAPGPRPRWLPRGALLAVQVATALLAWSLAPGASWTAVLFVVTVVPAALLLPLAGTVALVVLQSAAVVAGTARAGGGTDQVVVVGLLYGAFQVFAALVVLAGRREAEQRAALAGAHAELRAASALLASSARDAERLRIARDLHDVVGHGLTALALELEVASHRASGPAAEHVARARSIAKDLLGDVRSAVGGLRGEVRGLEAALREAVGGAPGLEVVLAVREEGPVDPDRALVVVRCVQELVTNALRHAAARRLTVDLTATAAGLHLLVRDDGRGTRHLRPGNGLTGMVERVEDTGGTIRFSTAPGRGFTAELEVPA
ncbi:sensor histidine kinase [Kineococcus esterisolvens]|uniref:sensor histidine kinase n=1 Tax=unclassified Kineococcus TaxID=2621656 RepID=UPI003D7C3682